MNLDNKNETANKIPDLIDLAPLTYSKIDLLNSLDENWLQRTGVVSKYIFEKKLFEIFSNFYHSIKGCRNYREKE
jgi:hypothetical protein